MGVDFFFFRLLAGSRGGLARARRDAGGRGDAALRPRAR